MTLSFCDCEADAERLLAEFMQSKTEGLAALTTDPGITTCRKHKCREGQICAYLDALIHTSRSDTMAESGARALYQL